MKRITAAIVLGLAAAAFAANPAPPAAASRPDPSEPGRLAVANVSDIRLQYVDSVLEHPGLPDADKEKLRALRKEFITARDKLLEEFKKPVDPRMVYRLAENLPDESTTYIQSRQDLNDVALRANMIFVAESGLVQTAVEAGDNVKAYGVLDTISINEAHRKSAKAAIDKAVPEIRDFHGQINDRKTEMTARARALWQMANRIRAAMKEVRAALSAEENQDLDWQLLKQSKQGGPANVLVFSTFTTPVRAPEDGTYSLIVDGLKSTDNAGASVNLKKGDTMGFRTVDKTLKAYAGGKEFPLPSLQSKFALWVFQRSAPATSP